MGGTAKLIVENARLRHVIKTQIQMQKLEAAKKRKGAVLTCGGVEVCWRAGHVEGARVIVIIEWASVAERLKD